MSFISGLSRNPLQGFTWEDIQRGGYSHPTEMSLAGADPLANFEAPKLPARRGGFFGSGGVGRNIVGSIGDFLLQQAGGQPIYAPQMEMQRRLQLHQMQREQENEDWMNRQNYEAKMRPPELGEFDRAIRAAGIDPASEQARQLYLQRAQNMANPMQAIDIQQPDGSVVRQYIRPPMGGAGPQPAQAAPQPGAIEDGYRFRGGDPANPESWERVQGGAAPSNGPRRFR